MSIFTTKINRKLKWRLAQLKLFFKYGRFSNYQHFLDVNQRLIGIMMIRNENDILRETLENLIKIYDRIFVLSGTEPEDEFQIERNILNEFKEIKLTLRDSDTDGPFPIKDGARHYLLNEVRKK